MDVNRPDPSSIELPRMILIGNNVLGKTLETCRSLGVKGNPLVLMDQNTRHIAGDAVFRNLSPIQPISCLVQNSTQAEVERILSIHKVFDCVVGVGGGVVIDVGKMVAFKAGKPFISIPTAPSHDGIASERASLTDKGGDKVSLRAEAPAAIIADLSVLRNAPYRLIAAGCADAISNITSVHDWRLSRKNGEYYSECSATLALASAEVVMASADSIRMREESGIRNLVEALIASSISMSMVKSSRPASGAEHAFSHAMESLLSDRPNHPLHGEQVGVGAILMAMHQGGDWKTIKASLKRIGAPTTAKELGVETEVIVQALMAARKVRNRYTILEEKPLTEEMAMELVLKTGVAERI